MSYKVAAAAVARRATPKVSFGRAEAARREFLYMKLYMNGSNIDVQLCREKIVLFLKDYEGGFLYMEWLGHVEKPKSCRESR